MTQPYFSVGEEVILESKNYPEFNGEHVVEHIRAKGIYPTRHDLLFYRVVEGFAYKLIGIDESCFPASDSNPYFGQPTLRKKHPPSTESFSEMMDKINNVAVSQ